MKICDNCEFRHCRLRIFTLYNMYTQIMRVVQQGETFAVQSQKSENGQMMKCNIILQEMGGKYENQYAAAMLGYSGYGH